MALTGKPTKTDPTPTIASTFTRPGKTVRKATSIRIRLDLLQAAKVYAAEHETTLGKLIEQGLIRELGDAFKDTE
ncbi:hypothetical protein [Propionibacterium freudenreichii]|uniref:hypothetical protein n=1 Tax=Propionibacterium freudenreichii TaxID=1744 RepID=UPI00049F4672|nr:hypothetical protein [Propionibacterium freudenreichii]MCT2998503.1 hypothetical protein [Propionibacterium freudenreichii]MCT3011330.1 hypothetical protein [Propionibacterium freudenreichii]MDK9319395.1 hypothetical protein [Propionibacterium freudenreichii]MDK9641832.1 hypothetical protein [Propionibacterium freudenreichii]CDP48183.1 Putative uncharacterized protein [Propionibacterium freudenreichii subsp. freudenreichii]